MIFFFEFIERYEAFFFLIFGKILFIIETLIVQVVLMKIVDSSDDTEISESSSSVTDDELTLPDGVFIVQEIVDHKW